MEQTIRGKRPVIRRLINGPEGTGKESDEDGLITFTGAPDAYHVMIIDAPDGYSYDEDYEMYTAREYGEWILRVRKD